MKKIKAFIFSLLFVATGLTASAQGGGIWNFTYDMGFGMGNTSDFISSPSFRGFSLDGRGFVSEKITVGGRFGWQTFYKDMGEVTRKEGTYTLTGYNKRYINAMPLMATAHYYFTTEKFYSYLGVGIGTYYMDIRDQMGIYYVYDKYWHFGLSPELGVVIPIADNLGATLNLRYNFAAKTKKSDSYSWMQIGVGLSYHF